MRLLLSSVVGALAAQNLTCQMTPAYPPPANMSVPWFEVNLDLAPKDRWTGIVAAKAPQIANLLEVITRLVPDKYLQPLLTKCNAGAPEEFLNRFPAGYGDEIQSIADVTKIPVCEIIFYNLAYEILGGCTSIIAQDPSGYMYHARTLDFGLGPFNGTEGQWQLTDALRPLIFNANFTKGGKTVFYGTHYAGYIGFTTAVKPGYSLTVDTRFDDTYSHFLIEWLENKTDTANFLTFLTRQAFETQDTFADTLAFISSHDMVGPSYTILAGANPGEGAVITNGPNRTVPVDIWHLSQGLPKNKTPYYLLQTNYDHWVEPPFFDNRQAPAMDCMNKLGQAGMTKENIYNVLHAHPNRNKLTTYITLIDPKAGVLETSIEYCEEKGCVPW